MKYSIPVTLMLSCALSATARAQEATAPVLADVIQDLELTSSGQTSFGQVGNFAHSERIHPAAPSAAQTTAMFMLSSNSGLVFYSSSEEVTLTEPVSSAVMTFHPELSLNFEPDQSGSTVTNRIGGLQDFPQAWFWLGGSLGVAQGQVPGSYRGEFTLSVAYE